MLKKTHKILNMFARNPTRICLFSEVKKYIDSKSESYTYNSLKFFVKEGVLSKEKKGNFSLYRLANTPKAISFLSMAAEYHAWNIKKIPITSIYELVKKANINFFTLLVTGSYATGNQNSKSDLDIILIVANDAKKINSRLKHFCEMNIPKIDLYVFTADEFKQMLLDKKHNYGKEAVKNNLIFYGAEAYFKILLEVMNHGFSY